MSGKTFRVIRISLLVFLLIVAAFLISGCKKKTKITVSAPVNIPGDIYFWNEIDPSGWLGKPILVKEVTTKNGKVKNLEIVEKEWPTGIAWESICQDNDVGKRIKSSFDKSKTHVIDHIVSNTDMWKEIRKHSLECFDQDTGQLHFDQQACYSLFPGQYQERIKALHDWFKNPLFKPVSQVQSSFSLSMFNLGTKADIKAASIVEAGFKMESEKLSFDLASVMTILRLDSQVQECMFKAANQYMSDDENKATHIVNSVSLGAMFNFTLMGHKLEAQASADTTSQVAVTAEVDFNNINVSGTTMGRIDTGKFNSDIISKFSEEDKAEIDKYIIEYLNNFTDSISEPTVVSGGFVQIPVQ